MTAKDVDAAMILEYGGQLEKCPKHREAWQAGCDDCGYSFGSLEAMARYHAACGFGPTGYRKVTVSRNPVTGEPK